MSYGTRGFSDVANSKPGRAPAPWTDEDIEMRLRGLRLLSGICHYALRKEKQSGNWPTVWLIAFILVLIGLIGGGWVK